MERKILEWGRWALNTLPKCYVGCGPLLALVSVQKTDCFCQKPRGVELHWEGSLSWHTGVGLSPLNNYQQPPKLGCPEAFCKGEQLLGPEWSVPVSEGRLKSGSVSEYVTKADEIC